MMAAIILIMLIGGRIIPAFTRNWLMRQAPGRLPVAFNRFDGMAIGISVLALIMWIIFDTGMIAATLFFPAAVLQFLRLARWQGLRTGAEALVWVLHAGYAFVPLGFLALALGWFDPSIRPAALHVWLAGAVGLMTLAVMTRASLGHAGRPLHATRPTVALYAALIVAVLARFAAGAFPGQSWFLHLAAGAWIAAFGGFVAIYWPILARPRAAPRHPTGGSSGGH